MGVRRIRDWSYPDTPTLDGLVEWAQQHHYDHAEESAERILDFQRLDDTEAPVDATYVCVTANGTLTNERTIAVTTGLQMADAGAGGNVSLGLWHLGIENLTDPGADKIMFWDDSATACKWLTASTGLTLSGTGIGTKVSQGKSDTLNVYFGTEAGGSISTGDANTCIGEYAGHSVADGDRNTYLGDYAGRYNASGDDNTFIGSAAGYGNSGQSHSDNTGIGSAALYGLTTGTKNVALGFNAGGSISSGASNIMLGHYSGSKQSTNNNLLIVDNQQRADVATELSNAIIYGVMAAATADQTLYLNANVVVKENIKIAERASAAADTEGYGQLWIKNADPCELWFTDDAGTDTQIV